MKRASIAALALALAFPAAAGELPAFHKGVRPLGMGGAFTAVSDDQNALFYNPAGLDKVEKTRVELLNPLLEANNNGLDFYGDVQDTDLDEEAEVIRLLRAYLGDNVHARAALFPNLTMRRFALGVLGQVVANVRPENPTFPQARVDALGSVSGHAGAGFGFFDGKLRVGAALKYVRAERLREVYTATEIAAEDFNDRVERDRKSGAGFGVDVGAMVQLAGPWKPTVAVTVQNVADTDLGDAGELPQQVNVGVSATHSFGWLTLVGAADWVDVTKNVQAVDPGTNREVSDDDIYRRLHFGVEGRLGKRVALRAGLHQGYASFGGTLDLRFLRIDYANYAEELGAFAGQQADRRHALQVSLGW